MEFHLVQNRKENCHRDHISFNVKGNGNIVFSVYKTPVDSSLEASIHENGKCSSLYLYEAIPTNNSLHAGLSTR